MVRYDRGDEYFGPLVPGCHRRPAARAPAAAGGLVDPHPGHRHVRLVLSGPGESGGDHDWNELFYRFGLLGEPSVRSVAALTHLLGALLMLVGLGWSLYFLLPPDSQDRIRRALSRR